MINKTASWFGVTVVTALVLKYLHMISQTNDLMMILWPVKSFLEILLNTPSVYRESGFFFPELNILLDKSCSGAHFFILAFCVFSSTTPHHLFKTKQSVLLFAGAFVLAYGLTIAVTSSRVVIAIFLLQLKTSIPWITAHWVHEAEGAFVYLSTLLLAYLIVKNGFIKFKHYYAKHSSSSVAVVH
jgi:exosortase K